MFLLFKILHHRSSRAVAYPSAAHLRSHMQRCGVHVCCSNSEGFGHTIVEAMSRGALVIITDFPPMNELIDESRGVLVRTRSSKPMRYGRFAQLDRTDIERAVSQSITMEENDYRTRCHAARAWFLQERVAFEKRLADLLQMASALRLPARSSDPDSPCRSTLLQLSTLCPRHCSLTAVIGAGAGSDTNPPVEITMLSYQIVKGCASVCAQPKN